MLALDGTAGLVALLLWLVCLFDAIATPAEAVRHLPKLLWVLLVATLPEIGSLLWLALGRPRRHPGPARRRARVSPLPPDDDPEFLRRL
ncbi:MAG: PLD nuclease N-terminal domain-containing protein [Mycobacteriales bacterium]